MRKLVMFFVIAVFAFGMAAGSVWGEESRIEITNDEVTVAEELLVDSYKKADLEKGQEDYPRLKIRDIKYIPQIAMEDQSNIVIEISDGGAIEKTEGNTMYLLLASSDEENCSSGGDGVVVASLSDYELHAEIDNAYRLMRFDFSGVDRNNDGDADDQGEETINSGEILYLSAEKDEVVNCSIDVYSPTIIIKKGLKKEDPCVYIQVTGAVSASGEPKKVALTKRENIACIVEGLNAAVLTATSTIDAQDSRVRFLNEPEEGGEDGADSSPPGATDDTDERSSTARDLHVDETVAEIGFNLNSLNDKYTLTLTRENTTGVQDVFWSGINSNTNTYWIKTGDFTDSVGLAMLEGELDVEIHVYGQSPGYLQTGDWHLSLVINSDDVIDDQKVLDNYVSHKWDVNGMQVKIPYMVLNSPGYLSFIKVANEHHQDAGVQIDAIIWDVTQNTNLERTIEKEDIKVIPKRSITTITEAELMEAFELSDTHFYHAEMTLTVVAPLNSVHVAAFQKSPNGRTDIPILYNVYSDDARQWQ